MILFDIKIIIISKYVIKYIITGIIADIGLSKNDLLLNNIKGKNAINKFIVIFINVFILFLLIFNIFIKQDLEKNKDREDVNINIKNHINTVRFSIEFIKPITRIFLRTTYTG